MSSPHGRIGALTDSLVIFHGDCPDGTAARFAAEHAMGLSAQYVPAVHGMTGMPDPAGRRTFVLDFAIDRNSLLWLADRSSDLELIDHHVTSLAELADLHSREGLSIVVDTSKSAAVLAWERFHPGTEVPYLVSCVQDRDIWRWQVPGSREFLRWLDSNEYSYELYRATAALDDAGLAGLRALGAELLAADVDSDARRIVMEAVAGASTVNVSGWPIALVECPRDIREGVSARLRTTHPVVITYTYVEERDVTAFSVRSAESGPDISAACAAFPHGGGHSKAAGFSLTGRVNARDVVTRMSLT